MLHMAIVDDQTMQVPVPSSYARQNNTGSTLSLVGCLGSLRHGVGRERGEEREEMLRPRPLLGSYL